MTGARLAETPGPVVCDCAGRALRPRLNGPVMRPSAIVGWLFICGAAKVPAWMQLTHVGGWPARLVMVAAPSAG